MWKLLWPHRVVAAGLFFAAVAGAALVWALGAHPPSWYPRCVFHEATGLNCPGCGSARAVHALFHGEWLAALHDNALFVLLLPLLLCWAAVALWRGVRHNAAPLQLPSGTAKIVLIATLVFVLARNLPWWPCSVLAPLS